MLLILDNCEHLVEAAARLVDALLAACPNLRVLATSREPLGVPGEAFWRVSSLSVPSTDNPPAVGELSRYDAVRLFLDRARLRLPNFGLTAENALAVAEICQRLAGIPLAIELAAARVGTLAVEQISTRLKESLKLLTAGSRKAVSRQRTLRGALDWSYQLLDESERKLFGRLSTFAGGWTLEAAEAVGAGGSIDQSDVVDLLSKLVDKSLVVAEVTGDGVVRYQALEPVRQYALEKLEASGEAGQVRRQHAEFFLGLAEETEPELYGPRQGAWLDRLESEHDNLRAALSWSLEQGEAELRVRLGGALEEFWHMRGHLSDAAQWSELLEAALANRDVLPASVRAKALDSAAWIAWQQGNFKRAVALGKENWALTRKLGDTTGIADSLFLLGVVALHWMQLWRAPVLLEEALAMRQELGNEIGVSYALYFLGYFAVARHDYGRADALHQHT